LASFLTQVRFLLSLLCIDEVLHVATRIRCLASLRYLTVSRTRIVTPGKSRATGCNGRRAHQQCLLHGPVLRFNVLPVSSLLYGFLVLLPGGMCCDARDCLQEADRDRRAPSSILDDRLDRALEILETRAALTSSTNPETLGLAGAIYKRKWEIYAQRQHLEHALMQALS
jgi:hypothetical protein